MRGFRSCFAFWVVLASSSAWAGPTLVVLEDNASTNLVYREAIEGVAAQLISNNLSRHYDRIELLVGKQANKRDFLRILRNRGAQGPVDAMILTHGSTGAVILTEGNLSESDLGKEPPIPGLRMVYMMGCYSGSLLESWERLGARAVIGHAHVNSLSGVFFPRFLRLWGQGKTLHESVNEAHRFAVTMAAGLNHYLAEEQTWMSPVGVARSQPLFLGENLTVSGDLAAPIGRESFYRPVVALPPPDSRRYVHSDFETAVLQTVAVALPDAKLDYERIPNVAHFLETAGEPLWSMLSDVFPVPLSGFELDDREIWIDGEAIRSMLSPFREWGGLNLAQLIDQIKGVKVRKGTPLEVVAYFEEDFRFSFKSEFSADNWQLYSVDVPRTVRVSVDLGTEGLLRVSGLDEARLNVKLPFLPDGVRLRHAALDLATGKLAVEAGVVGDALAIVANATVTARKLEGIDVWESIRRNLPIFEWPDLRFAWAR